ncbi:isocitrate lyase/PEP mutase family protein [Actinomadura parmotrematis]|uniref:Isocitrate lyase/phosphoenolpyruvate mutase family protein n=1 Tax=Actinomadura parmotrematis TaxID=2864039 RepID=A0ABS7FZ35_9ACTN|nr:isocitrate lyase/phosphoenolpyruvate mutase family protein [Actinomadura parmotrematis]MBW8485702.1 isocitrate lyase/phosphoenolpyruvate mutase family protein [Actinomadura parmotrematis]
MTGTFHALHRAAEPLLLPNAWDHASALALARAGFAAVGTTSLGVAAAAGKPDAGGATLDETLRLAAVASRLRCPLTVDIEAGLGATPQAVADVAARLADLGVAGVNLEDGRPDGTLTPVADRTATIAAVKARVPDLFVNARTDTYWLRLDDPLAETLTRATAYTDAGADGFFAPGITDPDDIRALTAHSTVPVNVLYQPGMSLPALGELGVRRVSLGSLLFRAALDATLTTALAVAADRPVASGLPSYADVATLIDPPR